MYCIILRICVTFICQNEADDGAIDKRDDSAMSEPYHESIYQPYNVSDDEPSHDLPCFIQYNKQ